LRPRDLPPATCGRARLTAPLRKGARPASVISRWWRTGAGAGVHIRLLTFQRGCASRLTVRAARVRSRRLGNLRHAPRQPCTLCRGAAEPSTSHARTVARSWKRWRTRKPQTQKERSGVSFSDNEEKMIKIKETIKITNRYTESVLYTSETADSLREAVIQAVVEGVVLRCAFLRHADLTGAYLVRAYLAGANLTAAELAGADLSGADLARADLARANLSGADLSDANLARANLRGADLTRANLVNADLTDADLTGADLTGADLTNA